MINTKASGLPTPVVYHAFYGIRLFINENDQGTSDWLNDSQRPQKSLAGLPVFICTLLERKDIPNLSLILPLQFQDSVLCQKTEENKQMKQDLQRAQSLFTSAERELRYEKEKNMDLKRHNTLLDQEKLKVGIHLQHSWNFLNAWHLSLNHHPNHSLSRPVTSPWMLITMSKCNTSTVKKGAIQKAVIIRIVVMLVLSICLLCSCSVVSHSSFSFVQSWSRSRPSWSRWSRAFTLRWPSVNVSSRKSGNWSWNWHATPQTEAPPPICRRTCRPRGRGSLLLTRRSVLEQFLHRDQHFHLIWF